MMVRHVLRALTARPDRLHRAVGLACLSVASIATGADSTREGKKVFTQLAQPSCTVCHTLADAQSQGQIGPNLDNLKPDKDRVYKAVSGGVGAMPSFNNSLSEAQRRAVAKYVAEVTGGSSTE